MQEVQLKKNCNRCISINIGIYPINFGAREASFRTSKNIAECLADELITCSQESNSSYAIRKKDEIETAAKTNR